MRVVGNQYFGYRNLVRFVGSSFFFVLFWSIASVMTLAQTDFDDNGLDVKLTADIWAIVSDDTDDSVLGSVVHEFDLHSSGRKLFDNGVEARFKTNIASHYDPTAVQTIDVEDAYVSLKNRWGEARLGRQEGIAENLGVFPRSLTSRDGANFFDVDREGLLLGVSDQTVGDFDERIAYISPKFGAVKFGQVRVAFSYSPWQSGCRADKCQLIQNGVERVRYDDLSDHTDLMILYTAKGKSSQFAASASITQASWPSDLIGSKDFSATKFGMKYKWQNFLAGASYYKSNGGFDRGRDYSHLDSSLIYELDNWSFQTAYSTTRDEFVGQKAKQWQLATRYELENNVGIAFGVNAKDIEPFAAQTGQNNNSSGFFLRFSYD